MPPEGIEIVQRSRLRENSEYMESKEVSRRSPRELKFVRYIRLVENHLNDELM